MNDGRSIDLTVATLEGEAAQQIAPSREEIEPPPVSVAGGYYGRPYLKPPVWIWSIPTYFFVGGIAGSAMTMGWAAQMFGGREFRRFEQHCRWVGALGGCVGTALLIHDLGRKERFLFMLRVFRPTSAMSVGSWVLATATPLSAGSALLARADRPLRQLGDTAGAAAGLLGMPLAAYTAVLLANTAVPLWRESRRSLPLLFAASSMASMASLFELMSLSNREQAVVRRFGTIGRAGELAASLQLEREAGPAVKPLRQGAPGTLWNAASVLTASSLVVSLLPGKGRKKRILSGVLGLLGSACVRFAVFHAGKASARAASPEPELPRFPE
ncbi:MAG TPA: NrfD/PsrC family molybdoenzyme membrane anchor subunit [Bryobacteraceae bacterium]|nr:NrfD/PsrC family molybdoenzyme membrane anchor subunit [Bryobacteraceae bacterium]